MVNDGKFICKRFFANFEKLKREVESEEAFFFNDDGVYCQVGTSIFDRWEQVTLIDPEWTRPSTTTRSASDSIGNMRPNAYPSKLQRRRRSIVISRRRSRKAGSPKMI